MRRNPRAFDQLEALLSSRRSLYSLADHTVDTSEKEVYTVVNDVLTTLQTHATERNRSVA